MAGHERIVVEVPSELKNKIKKRVKYLKKHGALGTQREYFIALANNDLENNIIFLGKNGRGKC